MNSKCCNYCIICMHCFAQPWERPLGNRLGFFRHGSGAKDKEQVLTCRFVWRHWTPVEGRTISSNSPHLVKCSNGDGNEGLICSHMQPGCSLTNHGRWIVKQWLKPLWQNIVTYYQMRKNLENKSYITLQLNRDEVADPPRYLDNTTLWK